MKRGVYKTNRYPISGGRYRDIERKAIGFFDGIKSKSKRRPYVRSKFFKKEKIFLDIFWRHLHQKNWRDRKRRLSLFPCSIDLIQNTAIEPVSKINKKNKSRILHRFIGETPNNMLFAVQVVEEKKTGVKYLISVFPWE